jgi:hypothetical protein
MLQGTKEKSTTDETGPKVKFGNKTTNNEKIDEYPTQSPWHTYSLFRELNR